MNKTEELEKLYQDMVQCKKCQNVIANQKSRIVLKNTLDTKIVLMAQAPGDTGVRLTGVHWNRGDGSLTRSGYFLNKQLIVINLTINLNNNILPRPYTTNVLQCWPGRVGNSKWDRPPKMTQIDNCKKWWQKELEIIQPEIIVFLGAETTKSFGKAIGKQWIFKNKLESQGEDITIGEMSLKVFFLPHPAAPFKEKSYLYRTKSEMYQEVFRQVRDILNP